MAIIQVKKVQMRSRMNKYFYICLLFVAVFFNSCQKKGIVYVQSNQDEEVSKITVTNMSVVSMTADCVSFDVTVRERADSTQEATDKGNIKANRVKSILKSMNITDVFTSSFSVSPYYFYEVIDLEKNHYDRENETKKFMYSEYVHTMTVKIKNANLNPQLVGNAIDSVLRVENAEINNINYTILDNRKANAAVRKSSAQAVMKKIKSYADGCGVNIKSISQMREGTYTRDSAMPMAGGATKNTYAMAKANTLMLSRSMMDSAEEDADEKTQISSDKVNFSAEVDYTALIEGDKKNTLNVRGFWQVETDPDVADFTITINLNDTNTLKLAQKSAQIVKDICTRLDGRCEMTSTYYDISPYFVPLESSSNIYHADRANNIKYYVLTHNINIRVKDFNKDNKLGEVIDLVKKGTADTLSIGSINYSVSDSTSYADEARKGAASNGKEKCDIYASGAQTKCVGVYSIRENYSAQDSDIDGDDLYYGKSGKVIYKGSDISDYQTVIFRGKVSVRSQLTVTVNI